MCSLWCFTQWHTLRTKRLALNKSIFVFRQKASFMWGANDEIDGDKCNLHYYGYGWMKCTLIFLTVSSDKAGTLLGPWEIFKCGPRGQLSGGKVRKERCDMQFFDQGRWFKEQALIPGLRQKFAVRLCWGAVKRVKHEAQAKCLLQGCLDAQSSLFQDQWPLLCPRTLLLGASGDTGCREHEWSWGWQSLSLDLWFSLGSTQILPVLLKSCRHCCDGILRMLAIFCASKVPASTSLCCSAHSCPLLPAQGAYLWEGAAMAVWPVRRAWGHQQTA